MTLPVIGRQYKLLKLVRCLIGPDFSLGWIPPGDIVTIVALGDGCHSIQALWGSERVFLFLQDLNQAGFVGVDAVNAAAG
jgi:hypothetical protein